MRLINIVGNKYGKLTVVSQEPSVNHRSIWKCVCECGKEKIAKGHDLKNGHVKSCGCTRHSPITHNKSNTPEYIIWAGMKARCTYTKHKSYDDYGAKGITISESWESFENFLADMGERPSVGMSIERKDNTKGYSKENCIWADKYAQAANRKSSIAIMHLETGLFFDTVRDAAKAFNLTELTLWRHIKKGKCANFVKL